MSQKEISQSERKSVIQRESQSVGEKARQTKRMSESQLYETIREREPNFSQSERKLNCPRKVRQSKRKSDSQRESQTVRKK